ncbi:MAG: hypothetical protein IJU33_08215 [Bacteroidales bacterium]|nr:hypothetical protein [Bacteroidales bacterium]
MLYTGGICQSEDMESNQTLIHQKIKEFVQKYYLNKLYKGAILFVAITLVTFIVYALLEYFSYFTTPVRTVLFYSYLALFAATLIFYVIIPLVKLAGYGKQISNEQIADIIGRYFPEIDDKLLNIFQLERQIEEGNYKSRDLLMAAIDTKIDKIKPFPFVKAIPFKKSTRYLKWAIIPVLLFCVLFSIKSEVFTESTRRIVHYQTYYEKPAPYSFEILNNRLLAFQNDAFELHVRMVGEETPDELFIALGKRNYKLKKVDNTDFVYTFSNLQRSLTFQLFTDEVTSKPYELKVLPKPVTISFTMQLDYPAYLNKNSETIDNNGDATVPAGTKITWRFYTKHTEQLDFLLRGEPQKVSVKEDVYSFSAKAGASFDYDVINSNQYFTSTDTLHHTIAVIPDQYPEISVISQRDSLYADRIYFKGNIKDDYGFHSLKFVYSKFDENGKQVEANKSVELKIDRNSTIQDFYHYFDAGTLKLSAGYQVEYYFVVYDNDAVNGFKMTKSSPNIFRIKTLEEIDKELAQGNKEAQSDYKELIKETSQLANELEQLKRQLLQNETTTWQDQKKMEALKNRFAELEKKLAEMQQEQAERQQLEEQFKNLSPELSEKEKDLQERLQNTLSDELKDMMKKLQDMMSNPKKNDLQKAVEKMKMSTESMNESLEQQLQLFKQLEVEKKYNDVIEKTKQLAEEQKKLSTTTQSKAYDKKDLQQKQEEIKKKFDQLQKDLQDLKQMNGQLEEPNKIANTAEKEKSIQQKMQESSDALEKNNRNKASDSQQDAAQQMEEMANELEISMLESMEEQLGEDIDEVRQLLDNLVQVSFRHEANMKTMQKMSSKSPLLNDVQRTHLNVQDNMRMIADSLNALARRQPQVQPFVNKEVDKVIEHLQSAQSYLRDRQVGRAQTDEQFALTSMNNLALMLAESIQKMKEQQNQARSQCQNCKKGGGSCSKPGSTGKGKPQSAKEMQQQLNRQMEALRRTMEQEAKQAQQTSGKQPSHSEEFAKMAAQQEAIRKMMKEYQEEQKAQNGMANQQLDQMIRDMERTEKELVNKTITQYTIQRQKSIETRLLESERADMQQEKDEKRKSTQGRDMRNPNPPKEWNMDKTKEKQTEMLKTVPAALNYYYKEKVNQYFYNIDS